jgi:regulator of cell morphogenesis and NO signaling
MSVDRDRSLAELVLERPSAARVLERLGLDYCCGGRRSLRAACAARGLDADTVALESRDWSSAPPAELCAHIVEEHHARLRWELPRLAELAERVASAHGEARPRLHDLRDELERLRAELEEHMAEEERELFPTLAAGGTLAPARLEALVHEHDGTGARLRRLRELGGGYAAGEALCATHRALLQGLHGLELDLHQHVHEENNILFPRALAAAKPFYTRGMRFFAESGPTAAAHG